MSLSDTLYEVYLGMERRIVPGLEYSQHHYEAHLLRWIPPSATWLDVGCGRRLLPSWRSEGERILRARAGRFIGIDLDLDSLRDNVTADLRVIAPVGALPFRNESFDVVTANMVVEHLESPGTDFIEIARVLRPGGIFLFHTPNAGAFPTALARVLPDGVKALLARVLDGRRAQDVFPTHYRCNSSEDIGKCGREAGLVPVEVSLVSSTAVFAMVAPLALLELLWLRRIQDDSRRQKRSNLIAVLRKSS